MARKQWEVRSNCASAGLEGKEGGDWKGRLKHHPRPRRFQLRPPRDTRAITPGAPHYTATALSPDPYDLPRLRGGGVSDPSLSPPTPPCAAQLSPIRPGPAQPASTHGSDSSGGSSPAPASPPPTPGRSNAAGSEPRGAWRVRTRGGLCTRNRKLLFAMPPRRAGAFLGSGRFGPLCVPNAD